MRILIAFVLFVFSGSAMAWESPRQAIDEFLKLELACGRCQAYPFEKYLAVDPENYDEPGWDIVDLVEKAVVTSVVCAKDHCEARVLFSFVPTEKLKTTQIGKHPNGGTELVTYGVTLKGGQWLLDGTNGGPRVLRASVPRAMLRP